MHFDEFEKNEKKKLTFEEVDIDSSKGKGKGKKENETDDEKRWVNFGQCGAYPYFYLLFCGLACFYPKFCHYAAYGNYVFGFGGDNSSDPLSDIRRFDLRTKKWSILRDLKFPFPVTECSAVVLRDYVHIIGGCDNAGTFRKGLDIHWIIPIDKLLHAKAIEM